MDTRLAALAEASARIFAAESLEETLRHVGAAARDIVGAHKAVVSLVAAPDAPPIEIVSLSDAGPRCEGAKADDALAAPLTGRDGSALGSIRLTEKCAGAFDAADEAALAQLAGLAAVAVEHQRLVTAARTAERRFEAFAKLGNDVLWETDAEHRYTMFVARGDFRMRRSPRSFIGKTRVEAIAADPADPFWAAHIADLEAHRPIRGFEYAAPMGDGTAHRLRVNAEPQFDGDGRFTGYRGTTQDVTELRAAEALAHANEERFRDFAGSTSDWLWETGPDHKFTFVSPAREGVRRLPPDRALGRTRWELAGANHGDPHWAAHIADLDAHRPFRDFEYTLSLGDGTSRINKVSGRPVFAADGAFLGYRGTVSDISAQRDAEAAARKAAQQYRDIVETSNEGLWVFDSEMRIQFANRRASELLGYALDELLGRAVTDFVPEDRVEQARRNWRERRSGISARFEARYRHKDGHEIWVLVSATPRRDAAGTFIGATSTFVDITDRKRAEAALRLSEERYRGIVETANEGVWILDGDARTVFANRRMGEMLGYAPGAMIGRPVVDFRPPEDRGQHTSRWRERASGMAEQRELRFMRRDGTTFWALLNAQPMHDAAGKFQGSLGMVSDITARKEAEEALKASEDKFRRIVETANEGIWLTDGDLKVTFANRRIAEMLGYAPEELVGKSLFDFIPEHRLAEVRARVAERRAGQTGSVEAAYKRKDGSLLLVLVNTTPRLDAQGVFVGGLSMVVDISQQKRAEAALRASEDRFRDFAEAGSDWVWETDAEHRFTMLHGPASVAQGFALGKRRWEYGGVDPDAPEWRQHREDIAQRRPFRRFEYPVLGSNGEQRFFSITGKPIYDAAGAFVGYRGTTTDITALREAEQKARASEQRFKDFAGISSDWMWETDAQHRFRYFSSARDLSQPDSSASALGKTRWEFAGGDLSDPKWQGHLADLEAHRPFRQFEYRYRRPDGSEGSYFVSGVPVFGENGAFVGYRGTTTDVTPLREAESAAAASEKKFRQIVETANEGIWMLDADRRTTYVNPRMAEMLGYAAEEMQGRHHWDFMTAADRADAIEATRNRKPDIVERRELCYLRRDGTPLWVIVTSNVIDDPIGGTRGVLGMVTDITDRKRAEAAAAASEARFRDFAEIASDWMWETDAQHRLASMLGATAPYADLSSRRRWEFAEADPSDPEWRAHKADLEAHRPFRDYPFTVHDKDGRSHYLVASGRPTFDTDGRFVGYRGTTTEKTREREAEAAAAASERKFRQYVETAQEGVWMVDENTRTIYANPRTADMLGYSIEEMTGRSFVEFFPPEDRSAVRALWEEKAKSGVDRLEMRLRRKDGKDIWVLLSGSPQFDAAGRFVGAFAMLVDITARKAAERAAERAKREVDAILASISDGFVALDNEWRFTYVNAAAERIVGRKGAEGIGRSPFEMLNIADDNVFAECYRTAKREGQPVSFAAYSEAFGLWLEVRAYPHTDGLTIFFRDVTAERHSHRALAASERKFRQIVETASEGLWITNRSAEIAFANPRLEQLLGYGPGELVGKSIFDTIPADRVEEVRRHWRERGAGRSGRFEARHIRKDGSEVTMLLSATPLYDADGSFAGSFVMFVDISEQRRVQAALAESEQKLRVALEQNQSVLASISDGFVALDNDWRFTFINAAAERMWKRKASDMLGKTILDTLNVDYSNPFQANYLASKQSGEPTFFTAYSVIFDLWLEVRGYPHPGGFTFFFHDVSEERSAHRALLKSAKKLEAAREMNTRIFETSLDLICITDRGGNFLQVNPGTCDQFGYPVEELIGRNASEFIDVEGIELTRQAMRAARKSGRQQTFENHCRRKDGTLVPMNWSVAWSEREQKYFLIGRDMSERVQAQERLNRSQRLEAIGQLTGGIAHDFNNLLTVIMGNSEALARGLDDDERLRRRAELSVEAARRAAELTAQLLAFARRQTLAPKAVEVNRLVRDLEELMRRSLGNHVEVDFRPGPSLWLSKVDATQLETSLLNLALNARDAMPDGGRLTISTTNRTVAAANGSANGSGDLAAGDYVAIEVADTGTGMTPDVIARAFEPFFTTKDIGKGSGLGLAMVYGFAKQSGGHVTIESEPGHGTRVTIYLPRAGESDAATGPAAARDGAPLPGGSETILVVEDDAAVREYVTDQLRGLGYRVLVAGNGPTARNVLYGGEKVDLLFTDVMMPGGMTGTELAAEAEKQFPALKILFTTGYSETPALKQSGRGVALLRKPYKSRDLAHSVRQTLDAA